MDSIAELQRERASRAYQLRVAIDWGTGAQVALCASRLLEIDEQLNPSQDEPMTWKEPQTLRETVMDMANQAGMSGADLLPAELHLQQIENLPPITLFDTQGESK